jgi:spore coat protein U-like protein
MRHPASARKAAMAPSLRSVPCLTILSVLASAGVVEAATKSARMNVSASVVASAAVSAAPVSVAVEVATGGSGSTPLAVTLSPGVAASIRLDQGRSPGTGSTDAAPVRRMTANGSYLAYELYQDAGHTIPWANTAATAKAVVGSGSNLQLPVHVRVLPGQNVPAGTYTDTVTIAIDF